MTKLIDYFDDEEYIYVVTSHKNFGDLQTLMEMTSINYLTERELFYSIRHIVIGLANIHKVGYLHNDIQPSNILIHKEEHSSAITVALNGLARCTPIDGRIEEGVFHSEQNQFSMLYLAPEVVQSQGKLHYPASDVWSLGILLYTLACGRMPFADLEKVMTEPLNWLFADNNGVRLSKEFKSLVESMLQKDFKNRPNCTQILKTSWFSMSKRAYNIETPSSTSAAAYDE